MHTVTIRKTVRHSWADLFALVLDMEHYPAFVPGCARVRIVSRRDVGTGLTEIVSRMTVGVQPVQMSYTNRTRADHAARRIVVDSEDGPLKHLHVIWRFEAHGEAATDIAFSANYAFRNPIVTKLASGLFDSMFGQVVDSFERRATQLTAAHLHQTLNAGRGAL